jgi:hypothetical protein
MELFFQRPVLRELHATFLQRGRTDWMWFHEHDFDLTLDHPNILYIYRDPIDTIYSYLTYDFKRTRRRSPWGRFAQRNDIPYPSQNVEFRALEYRKHLEKWLLSSRKARTVIRYERMVQDNLGEFQKVCEHFEVPMDEERAKRAFAKANKESLLGVAVRKQAMNPYLLSADYASARREFRQNFSQMISDLVITSELKPFFTTDSELRPSHFGLT